MKLGLSLEVKIFLKQCSDNGVNCTINQNNNELVAKLKKNILKELLDEKEAIEKNKKEHRISICRWRCT